MTAIDGWFAALAFASVAGAVAAIVAVVVCRLPFVAHRPAVCCWWHRVVLLKFILALAAPALPLAILPPITPSVAETRTTLMPTAGGDEAVRRANAAVGKGASVADSLGLRRIDYRSVRFALWATGLSIGIVRNGASLWSARCACAESVPLADEAWTALYAELESESRRPALALSLRVYSPGLCGFFSPKILIPNADAGAMPTDRRRAVLLHELAHWRRGDLWWFAFDRVVTAVFFFHPLAWLAAKEHRLAAEIDCDRAVLADGAVSPKRFGSWLLEMQSLSPTIGLGATMAGSLERRLLSMNVN